MKTKRFWLEKKLKEKMNTKVNEQVNENEREDLTIKRKRRSNNKKKENQKSMYEFRKGRHRHFFMMNWSELFALS